jgi:hypothetical protein
VIIREAQDPLTGGAREPPCRGLGLVHCGLPLGTSPGVRCQVDQLGRGAGCVGSGLPIDIGHLAGRLQESGHVATCGVPGDYVGQDHQPG